MPENITKFLWNSTEISLHPNASSAGGVKLLICTMLMATVIMGAALYIPIKLLDQVIFDTTKTVNLVILTMLASIFALSIYVLLVWFMKVRELYTFIELLKKVGKIQNKIKSEEIVHEPETP